MGKKGPKAEQLEETTGRLCSSTKSVPCPNDRRPNTYDCSPTDDHHPTNNHRPDARSTNARSPNRPNTRSTIIRSPNACSQLAASDWNEDGDGDESDVKQQGLDIRARQSQSLTSSPVSQKRERSKICLKPPRREVRVNSDGSQTTVVHLSHTLAEVEQEARGLVEDTVNQPDYSGLEVITGDVLFLTSDGKTLGRKKTVTVGTISIIASCFKPMRRVSANKRQEVSSTPIPSKTDTNHSGICLVLAGWQ